MDEAPRRHPNIVIIEDDEHVAVMLRRHFERAGYAVGHAGSIRDARGLLEPRDWDVVVLDRNLPDGDGISLCHELRAEVPHGYILMLTGESSEEAKLEGFNCGADDYVTKPFQMSELLARMRAGLRIVELQKQLLSSNARLEELSLTDGLTGLRNRRAFDNELEQGFSHARRYERPLSVAIIDIDHFKLVNDTHGHAAGDAVLRAIAQILDTCTRGSDFVARIGGEEFAVLLPETPLFEALQFGEKVRAAIAAATIRFGETALHVTASAGIASTPHSRVRTAAELMAAADAALYRAKTNGRNRVEVERRRDRYAGSPAERSIVPKRSISGMTLEN